MSSLEDRIAAAIANALPQWYGPAVVAKLLPGFSDFAARAVVAELGLTQERRDTVRDSRERVVGPWYDWHSAATDETSR